jgi:hypothetical protein
MEKLNSELVERIIGPADTDLVAEILGTGATVAELLEAKSWLAADHSTGRETHRQPVGTVAQLCRILAAREAEEDRDP